jgi:tRNA-splicing ligase RtcB
LAFLPIESTEGKEYFNAMKYCMLFARANRSLMMSKIINIFSEETNATSIENIDIHHNYAAFENHYGKDVLVHRKGATKASLGLTGIIPGSMGTSSYITEGLGNPESFESCSHGAGRRMGRKEAERTLNLEEEQEKMVGIVHGLRDVSNLDEAPGAYKDINNVMENQKDLVKIKVSLKPLASIKG